MTSLVCTLVCVGQRLGVDWQAFRAKLGQGRGSALEWVTVQTPLLRHAVRALLVTSAALTIAGAVAVPVSASTMTPNAAKAPAAATGTAGPESSPGPTGLRIKAGALANAATGQILWSQDLNTERPIGSIVKVMTALVVIRAGHLDQTITVPKSVAAYLEKQDQPSTAGLIPTS